jgi:short-subunit dehydrogenase
MEKLQGKNVLIIGATGGIGLQTALMLKQSGANLFITGRNSTKLQAAMGDLKLDATKAFVVDVTQVNHIENLANQIHSQVSHIDILLIASGMGVIKPIELISTEEFNATIQTNLVAPFELVKAFLPKMKIENKGLIINIPGVLGKTPMSGSTAYSASKYGLLGLMQSVREELKRTNIRITNIFLGGVNSSFWDTIDLKVPKEKMITTEEAARSIWFLCQQPASSVVSEMVLQPFYHQAI